MAMPTLIKPVKSTVKKVSKPAVPAPAKPPKEKKPVVRLKNKFGKYHSPHSLNRLLNEEKKGIEKPVEGDENKPATPFDQKQMDALWMAYVSNHIDKKTRSLYLTLNDRTPELKDNFVLEFPVENVVQKQQIESVALDLVNYLREKLNNFSITLKTPVKEGKKQKSYYTTEERYKYLVKKYPVIEQLRKKLDLDFDF